MVESIAIIGMGCRFPGAADPVAFWDLLQNGISAIAPVPPERWNVDAYYAPEAATPGKMNTRYGGFLRTIDQFDPGFFGISPREAERMDPQQRLVLEVAWESLENATIIPAQLAGSATGVFIGCGNFDYGILLSRDAEKISAYDGTGSTIGIAANRLSYLLNLRGPSIALETACSSSLVALHLACRSLQTGESDLCLAGAVSLMLSPEQTIAYSQARMMAPDGRCKTFDADADGYVRGEGCGVVVLKRLSDALRDGDRIQAIVRGSAVNQDGLSNGLTAPNGPSQQAVIQKALQQAGVQPSEISYLEAHGTGTSLGDPIEVRSLQAVLGQGRTADQPCWLGSVKTNIGHLEAAAGMAGLIKTVLALQHRLIPPHLNLQTLNPRITLAGTPFAIPTAPQPWQVNGRRLAGISSFGFGGTNAHVILEEAPDRAGASEPDEAVPPEPMVAPVNPSPHLLVLSAKTEPALQDMAQRYATHLAAHPHLNLSDVCWTAATGRSLFEHRLAIAADSLPQLQERLSAFAAGAQGSDWQQFQMTGHKSPRVAFLFTGQGSQFVGMGRELYDTEPVFREVLDQCDALLRPYLPQPLLQVLYPSNGAGHRLDQTAYTQPALFALEYALSQLWQSWGIEPALVMGHSVGEYVAACVAGVFSLEDGLRLIAERGRLMQALPEGGGMVAVLATPDWVSAQLTRLGGVAIAAINGPQSVVISGPQSALDAMVALCAEQDVKTKPLVVSHAFHSPLMEPMVADFRAVLDSIQLHSPRLPLVSNLTGTLATTEVTQPDYWCQHILQPVRFAEGMQALVQQKCSILLEIGAKPILLGMGRACLETDLAESLTWLPSLRPGQPDRTVLFHSLAALAVRGAALRWQQLEPQAHGINLPTYPFQRQRYWMEEGKAIAPRSIPSAPLLEWLQQNDPSQLVQQLAGELDPAEVELLPRLLERLTQQHQQALELDTVQNWLYQVQWQRLPLPPQSAAATVPGPWLIFADAGGVGRALADHLQQQGQSCRLVYAASSTGELDPAVERLHPLDREGCDRLLQTFPANRNARIVYLWGLDLPSGAALDPTSLQESQNLGCLGVLTLLQSLLRQPSPAPLWLVTRGATAAKGGVTAPAQAPLWGMGRVVALEHSECWGGMVDLDPTPRPTEPADLIALMAEPTVEDAIALRTDQRYAARLLPAESQLMQPLGLSPDATYLITGGLGALGLRVAEWLVQRGARYLVLVGRRGADAQGLAAIARLEQAGATIQVARADVAEESDMARVLEELTATLPPLRGVIHAAGLVNYQTLPELEAETFAAVLRPKLLGGWVLHRLTQALPLDFFVLFSSIAAVWGSKGQAHYAAANHFLDALASYRQTLGLPATSINWGPWAEGGMASPEAQDWLTHLGVQLLPPTLGLTALGHLLTGATPQTTVASVNWTQFKSFYEIRGKRPLLEHLGVAEAAPAPSPAQAQSSALRQQLQAALERDRPQLLIAHLQTALGKVLGWSPEDLPDPERGFFEMGMDSLMAIEFRTRLETDLGTSLPATLAFEAPTIADLAEYLGGTVLGWHDTPAEAPPPPPPTAAPTPADWDGSELMEDELERLIADRIAKLEQLVRAI